MYYILLLLIIRYTNSERFKVCGAYCGPGWCNNQWIHETECNDTYITDSCTDLCCRDHDICCGHYMNVTMCNYEIVNCLDNCDMFSSSCKYDNIPVLPSVIADTMSIIINWCCGEPCP
jgi:hypothetical protein